METRRLLVFSYYRHDSALMKTDSPIIFACKYHIDVEMNNALSFFFHVVKRDWWLLFGL